MSNTSRVLSVKDINGAWAIMPTPAKPGAEDWRMTDSVDLDEVARVAEELVKSGVNGILSLGTFGEGASLTWEEKRQVIGTMVETVRGRVPYFCGTTSLNTRETIRQTKEAYDIGADGTMLGLPMWQICDTKSAVNFYRDVAEAVPDMSIAVYANPEAFKFDFPRPFWAQVADIPQVVTCKYIGVATLYLDLMLTKGKIRFLPIDMDYVPAARIDPENITAFWTSGTNCGPLPALSLRDEVIKAKKTGDWTKATELQNAILHTAQPLFPNGSFKEFSLYNVQLEKARFNAGGWMNAGPARPPYRFDTVPEAYLAGARLSGERWAELHKKLSQQGG